MPPKVASLLAEVCEGMVASTVEVCVVPVAKLTTSSPPLEVYGKLRAGVEVSSTCDTG
jgi:hypothetical protein